MTERDHFAANLDDEVVDEHSNFAGHATSDTADIGTEPEPKKKRSIPTPVLIAGGAVLVIGIMFGYRHFFKAKPNTQFSNAAVTALPADTGGIIPSSPNTVSVSPTSPLPPQGTAPEASHVSAAPTPQANLGMPGGPVSTGAQNYMATSTPGVQSNGGPLDTGDSSPAATVNAAVSAVASIPAATAPASGVSSGISGGILNEASSATTTASHVSGSSADDKDIEIRKLKRELKRARDALAKRGTRGPTSTVAANISQADSSPSDDAESTTDVASKKAAAPTRHTVKHKRRGVEFLIGYHIKQVIPGQGWIVDEESGKQTVVSVGDKVGTAEVTRIDADNYKIYTTAGVIQ
ncbi:hypothetical protein HQ619_08035 [Burkholderia gladioli]|uniref:hypothetical protein n=1 Tax=Burkholderia gladioli TaxID=28095 RepID=UPI00156197E7|nr:hypothetical protein [Burkholderia gladioli]NRF83875.1 hypothetical protein [Burkholderia gladioli]